MLKQKTEYPLFQKGVRFSQKGGLNTFYAQKQQETTRNFNKSHSNLKYLSTAHETQKTNQWASSNRKLPTIEFQKSVPTLIKQLQQKNSELKMKRDSLVSQMHYDSSPKSDRTMGVHSSPRKRYILQKKPAAPVKGPDIEDQLQKQVQDFNNNRNKSQYQKIQQQIMLNPQFKKKIELENFIEKVNHKCGIQPLDAANSNQQITKVNQQMLMLEQIFESRKQKNMKRPIIKSQVMNQLLTAKAGQQFLNDIKHQQKEIDQFLISRQNPKPIEIRENSFLSLSPSKSVGKSLLRDKKSNNSIFETTSQKVIDIMNFDKTDQFQNIDSFITTSRVAEEQQSMDNSHYLTIDDSQPSPFRPPYFKIKFQDPPNTTISDQVSNCDYPNFIQEIFDTLKSKKVISLQEKYAIMQALDEFYCIEPEINLDKKNAFLEYYKKQKKLKKKNENSSTLTVDACSEQINKILISQHQKWVQKKYKNYKIAEQTVRAKSNIFGRLQQDSDLRLQKHKLILQKYDKNTWQKIAKNESKSMENLEKYIDNGGKMRNLFKTQEAQGQSMPQLVKPPKLNNSVLGKQIASYYQKHQSLFSNNI